MYKLPLKLTNALLIRSVNCMVKVVDVILKVKEQVIKELVAVKAGWTLPGTLQLSVLHVPMQLYVKVPPDIWGVLLAIRLA